MEWGYFPDRLSEEQSNKYAVVVFLPEHLDEAIAPLREMYDPDYNLIAPHITLVFPFHSTRRLDKLAGIIKGETEGRGPIPIELTTIGDFYPKVPIIYWNVKKSDRLSELYYRLYSRLGMPIPFKEYLPHVTVAREISLHRVMLVKERIVGYLADEKFEAEAVDLITPLPENRWVSVRRFSMSSGTGR